MDWVPKRPVPVFPLPDVVMFPDAVMDLHIFELRYRTMVREALSAERVIAMTALAPGWEADYHGSPAFESLGCLVRFEDVEWLPNDHYRLRVRGFLRARLGRVVREFPYRACSVVTLPDAPYTADDPMAVMARKDLVVETGRLAPLGMEVFRQPPDYRHDSTLGEILGNLAVSLRLPVAVKLALLEEDRVVERARLLREHMRRLGPAASGPAPPPELGRN